MPLDESCPCGAEVKPGFEAVDYVTQALLDIILDTATKRLKFGQFAAAILGWTFDAASLCALPRPSRPRDFTLADFVVWFPVGQALAQEWLFYTAYSVVCQCIDCPPITDCGEGVCRSVTPDDGYPRPGLEETDRQYLIPVGADLWISLQNGFCVGPRNGVLITWAIDPEFNPNLTVQICNGAGNDCASFTGALVGQTVTICAGGEQAPPSPPFPEAPDGVADFPGPPACSTSDICTALDYVYETVRQVQFLVAVLAGPQFGLTTPIDATLPGVGAISGVLTDWLPRAVTALADIQQGQLVNPVTTPISESTTIDVTGYAFVRVELTTVPDWLGSRGAGDSAVYYSNHRTPGPGWAVLHGIDGRIRHQELIYPGATEIVLPSTCTAVAVHLSAGVAADVTAYERQV